MGAYWNRFFLWKMGNPFFLYREIEWRFRSSFYSHTFLPLIIFQMIARFESSRVASIRVRRTCLLWQCHKTVWPRVAVFIDGRKKMLLPYWYDVEYNGNDTTSRGSEMNVKVDDASAGIGRNAKIAPCCRASWRRMERRRSPSSSDIYRSSTSSSFVKSYRFISFFNATYVRVFSPRSKMNEYKAAHGLWIRRWSINSISEYNQYQWVRAISVQMSTVYLDSFFQSNTGIHHSKSQWLIQEIFSTLQTERFWQFQNRIHNWLW